VLQVVAILQVLGLVLGLPFLAGAIALGAWMRRTRRDGAFRTFLVASVSAALACLAAVLALLLTWVKENRGESLATIESHPLPVLLIFGLWLLAALAVGACGAFALWTAWRLVAAPTLPTKPAS
jgi:hypothetical protein